MATFEAQVNGITNLGIDGTSTDPGQTELTQFLRDGVIDVTSKIVALRPQDIENFQRESSISDSQGVNVGGAKIISVIREAGADGSSDGSTAWEVCRKIPASMQSKVVNVDSLHYASQYHPVYTMNGDKAINVYPTPSSNNGFKIFYVNEEPRDITNNAALTYAHSNIKYFPNDKVYLVVIYAAIQSLMAKMASLNSALPSDITLPVLPVTPSLVSVVFTSVDSSLDTIKPTFTTATISAAGVYTGDAPTFIPPVMSVPDFGDTNTWITTEEDPEMLASRVQEIQAKIGEYSARMAEAQAKFNKENIAYQSAIQESTQELQVANQVNLAEAQADLQGAMKNKDRDLQRQLQNGINDMQAIINDNNNKTAMYQSDIQKYSADIAGKVQEFTTSLQKDQADYQWVAGQYAALKAQYDGAFAVMAPPAPPQQVAQRRR